MCWRNFPVYSFSPGSCFIQLLSASFPYSGLISLHFFYFLLFLPLHVSPSMFPVLFNFPPLFLIIYSPIFPCHSSVYFLFSLLLCFCWCLLRVGLQERRYSEKETQNWQRLWTEKGRKSTMHYVLLGCVMRFLNHELRFVVLQETSRHIHLSGSILVFHFFFSLSFDLHSASPTPYLLPYLLPPCQPVLSGHHALWSKFKELDSWPLRNKTNLLLAGKK